MKLQRILDWMIYSGSLSFKPLEKSILDAITEKLDNKNSSIFKTQLEFVRLVQRTNENRMILIFLDKNTDVPTLENEGDRVCIASASYKICDRHFLTNVFSHKGRLFSLETRSKIESKLLRLIPNEINVKMKMKHQNSLSEEIDSEEHGPDS